MLVYISIGLHVAVTLFAIFYLFPKATANMITRGGIWTKKDTLLGLLCMVSALVLPVVLEFNI